MPRTAATTITSLRRAALKVPLGWKGDRCEIAPMNPNEEAINCPGSLLPILLPRRLTYAAT